MTIDHEFMREVAKWSKLFHAPGTAAHDMAEAYIDLYEQRFEQKRGAVVVTLSDYWTGSVSGYGCACCRNGIHQGAWTDDTKEVPLEGRPYRCTIRNAKDEEIEAARIVEMLAEVVDANDGDEVEISIRKTGNRPFGDRKIKLIADHKYEREPEMK